MTNRLRISLLVAACAATPSYVSAQSTGAVVQPLGHNPGGYSFDLSDGEPISWFLEYSEPLKLTPDQKTSLIAIRRRLRGENERFMTRLDSVATAVGLTLGDRPRMTADERLALERFNRITQPTRDSIRANNTLARTEALTLLNSAQQTRLDSLITLMQRERGRGAVRRRGAGVGDGGGS
jgi:hypothetical protein